MSAAGAEGQGGGEVAATRELEALGAILERLDRLTETVARLEARIPHVVSIGQAAQALQVTERTIRRWVRDRKLHATKVGSVVRVDLGSFAHH